jgi:putative flippase GtrA
VHYLIATPLAVTFAVVHNFVWHRMWTWKDRDVSVSRSCARFVCINGLLSAASNLGVTAALVSGTHIHPVVANALAIMTSGLLNFWLGDVVVFR